MLDADKIAQDLWLALKGIGAITPAIKGYAQGYVAMLKAAQVSVTVSGVAGTPGPIASNNSIASSLTALGSVMFSTASPLMGLTDPVGLDTFKKECDGVASFFTTSAVQAPFLLPVSDSVSGAGTSVPPSAGVVNGTVTNKLSPSVAGVPVVPTSIPIIPKATTQILFYNTLIQATVQQAQVTITIAGAAQTPAGAYTGTGIGVIS